MEEAPGQGEGGVGRGGAGQDLRRATSWGEGGSAYGSIQCGQNLVEVSEVEMKMCPPTHMSYPTR